MMRTAILTTVTLLSSNVLAGELIGTTVPPFPRDLVSRGGACIASARRVERTCDYSISIVVDSKGKPRMLVGERFSHRTGPKNTFWIVTDVVEYPRVPDGYELAVATCRDKGKLDPSITAVVRVEEEEWLKDVLWIRRFDMNLGRFIEIPSAGVECENPNTGDE